MKNIVLIGFMACGKSTIGTLLADNLGYRLVDTDEEIVKEQGKSINDIFAQEGEAYFRKLETQMVEKMCDTLEGCIISTGGGLPITKGNDEILKKLGTVIYLTVTKETVLERIKGDTTRPLLAEDAQERTQKLLEYRKPIYEMAADYSVKTDGRAVEDIVEEIVRVVQG